MSAIRSLRNAGALSALILLAGCGGGGKTAGTASDRTQVFGNLSALGLVSSAPVEAGSSNSKIIGLVGSFSDIRVRDVEQTPDEAVLYYAPYDVRTQSCRIDTVRPNGKTEPVTQPSEEITKLRLNAAGSRIFYLTSSGALKWIWRTGSAPTTVIASNCYDFALSPDGNRILAAEIVGSETDLFIRDLSGNVVLRATDSPGSSENCIAWLNSNQILFRDLSQGEPYGIELMDAVPGATPVRFLDGAFDSIVVDPTQAYLLGFALGNELRKVNLASGRMEKFSTSALALHPVLFGPGGNYAIGRFDQVLLGNLQSDQPPTLWFKPPQPSSAYDWYRGPVTRVLVGSGGQFRSTASGVIFAQGGTKTQSVVVFDATTPSTVSLSSKDFNTIGPNILYTAEADGIPRISFTEGSQQVVTNLTTNAGTNGAMISFDSSDGSVASIITYTVTRSSGKPTVRSTSQGAVISGANLTAYGPDGKVVSEGTEVRLDPHGNVRS